MGVGMGAIIGTAQPDMSCPVRGDLRRAFGPVAAQAGNAAAARVAMAGMSPAFIEAADEATSPVRGLMRVKSMPSFVILFCYIR
jgi:hypothetical protein